LIVHDTVIHDSVCDGINFATVDPSQGPVKAFSNVIYNAGTGPDPGGEYANYSCIFSADETDAGSPGAGNIVTFQVGFYDSLAGTLWADDVGVEEAGLTNVLRRPGTPVVVRNERTGEVYDEGVDYAPIADPHLDFRWDHEGPAISLLPGGSIRAAHRLRVDYFHGVTIYRKQVVADMSEPEVYEIWKRQLPLLEKYLAPAKYFLSMDEIRVGGFCKACQDRHLPMNQILGDCVKRQVGMIRAANPHAGIFIWSDMFDPNHNAQKQYYLIDGSFSGTWKYLPKRMTIVCWYYDRRNLSLPFFSNLGYPTVGAAYYDAESLDDSKGWLRSLAQTHGAIGIMYTTWQNKYRLLPAFGDLVSGKDLTQR
jgi:hypothetical protein